MKSKDEIYKCASVPLKSDEIKTTTGAGDLFISGFLFGLFQGYSLEQCARLGCLSGREVCKFHGSEIPTKNWEQLQNEMNDISKNFKISSNQQQIEISEKLNRKPKLSTSPEFQNETFFKFEE